MSGTGMIFAAGSAGLVAIGVIGLTRKPRPARRPDRVSLIELAIASLDPDFEPLPEPPWERKLDRLLCWIAVVAGIVFVLDRAQFLMCPVREMPSVRVGEQRRPLTASARIIPAEGEE